METVTSLKKENISIVQNAFDQFLKGNIPGVLDSCTEDVKWGAHENPGVPYAQTYSGKKGVADFFATLADKIDYTAFQPKEFFSDANRVFVKGYHQATVKSTGKTFGHDFLMEFGMRDGKFSSFFAWVDSREQANAFSN